MNEKNRRKLIIGMVCVGAVLLVALVAAILMGQSSHPTPGNVQTEFATTTEQSLSQNETAEGTDGTSSQTPATSNPTGPNPTESTGGSSSESQPATENTVDQNPTETTGGSTEETQPVTQNPTDPEEPVAPPEELPPTVVIPPETDPETGEETGISFPCQIPEYDLTIEKMAPYAGMFVEDGTNATTENVAMLLVKNEGAFPVEYTQIRVMWEQEEYLFDISALPAGQRLVVQEKTGKSLPEGQATAATALVVQRANMEMSEGKVKVTDNGNNTLTIENLTEETISTVRVFYKYYMENEDVFVGGIAFTVRLSRLGGGAKVTIQPAHYTSQTSRVVMVLTYDTEV